MHRLTVIRRIFSFCNKLSDEQKHVSEKTNMLRKVDEHCSTLGGHVVSEGLSKAIVFGICQLNHKEYRRSGEIYLKISELFSTRR